METTSLSSKGQVIIPKAIRESHHWQPGTRFIIEETADGIILRTGKPFPPTRIEDGLGCAGYRGAPKTLEEIEEALAADLRKKWQQEGKR